MLLKQIMTALLKKRLMDFARILATLCVYAGLAFAPTANAALFSTDWVPSSPIPNSTAHGTLGAINVTLSTGVYANAGGVFPGTWGQILPPSLGVLSPDEGISIAFPCNGTAQQHSVTFSTSVANPYLLFNYVDAGTVYNFSTNSGIVSLEGNTVNASLNGGIVTIPSSPVLNRSNNGFVVRLTGTYSTINFTTQLNCSQTTGESAGFAVAETGFAVTPSAGANGTISPNQIQVVLPNTTTSFTVTPNPGYTAQVGGTCGGSLSGTTFTTSPVTADCTVTASFTPIPPDPIKEALTGCGVITFDSNAQSFRTASTFDNRSVNSGPFNAPYVSGSNRFQWEATGGNPGGHLRADDMDGQWQEVWTPAFTDPDFSVLNGQQLQFDYRNDTGYNQYRLYIAIVGTNGSQYYYYFNDQLGSPGTWSRVKVPMVASAWHTLFESNESPATPPDSPAPSTANFAAVLSSLSRIAISVEGVQGADTSRFDNFGRACDWGDLPESGTSFATTGTNNGARHNISDAIRLGALTDTEPDGQPTTAANGDDTNFSDDEDGLTSLPPLPISTANYSLQVAVTNTTGSTATLYGWIDWDGNNRFEPAEIQTATVPGNGSVTSVTLTWPNVRVGIGATAYARLRFTTFPLNDDVNTPADERAQGIASDGEVEDYLLSAAPLGSLTVIKNTVGGDGSFSFNTAGLSPTSFTLTTAGGTAQLIFPNLLPGFYSVTELLSPVWNLTSATCSDGSPVNNIDLALSENVTCTFTNQAVSYSVGATVSGGYGGTVSCTPASVAGGGSSACTAVPDPGFRVLTWGGDCAAAGSNVQCSLTNIFADKFSTVSFTLIPPATYNVTATVVGGSYGSVGCYPSSVKAGESSTCIAVAFTGFRVKSWGGACATAGSNVQCTLPNIQADQVSTVSFELTPPATYTVTATVVGGSYGGSVGCYPSSVKAGESSTCIAVAKSGFRVLNWGGACATAGSNVQCTLPNIQANQVSTVSFELIPPATYNVTATVVGGNGSVGCYPNSVKAGESSNCIAVAYTGYQVQAWSGACATAGNAAQCSLTNIQADKTSTVSFVAQPVPTYTVSATVSGGNGTVSCAPSPVPQGDSSSCTAAPDPGYQVAAWTGDCAANGQNVHCALSNIQRDQSSEVSFALIPPNSYSVTATVALGYGSVSCTPNTVTAGGSSTCTAVPEASYQVQDWSGACAATGSQAQCNLTNIQANQTSTVSFTPLSPNPDTYTVNATVTGGNGTVSCDPTRVAKGGQSACAAVPATGYQVQAWSGDCAFAGSDAHCYLPKIQKNQTSTVSFAAIPPGTVHVFALVAGGNGTVSCTPANVPIGGNVTCIATPEAGYQVAYWDGACLLAGNNPQCNLTNLQSDQRTTVAFVVSSVVTPPITDVPTLSEWGLLLLGTLLALRCLVARTDSNSRRLSIGGVKHPARFVLPTNRTAPL
ncbi:MAG: GEVED domain-containing protein [Candidatus Competibacter sp.]